MKRVLAAIAAAILIALAMPAGMAENAVLIYDSADLLTTGEEAELYQAMAPVREYGMPVFRTTAGGDDTDAETAAANFLQEKAGQEDGIIFVIDLEERQIVIYSTGNIHQAVTSEVCDRILNNTYMLATAGDYAGCAEKTFAGILAALEGEDIDAATKQDEEPEVPGADEALQRLTSFFAAWGNNNLDQTAELCAPSWRAQQENVRASLFTLLQNRTPVGELNIIQISDTDGNSLRITLNTGIDRNNGKDPQVYRMNISMLFEDGEWYADPLTLQTTGLLESSVPPDAPTPAPETDGNMVLYYNPDGGRMYHKDPYCKIVHEKYTPLKGTFTYGQLNEPPYAELEPCSVCGAPLRTE